MSKAPMEIVLGTDTNSSLDPTVIEDVAYELRVSQAILDCLIDARENTCLEAVMLTLECVSRRLSESQTRLLESVAGDE